VIRVERDILFGRRGERQAIQTQQLPGRENAFLLFPASNEIRLALLPLLRPTGNCQLGVTSLVAGVRIPPNKASMQIGEYILDASFNLIEAIKQVAQHFAIRAGGSRQSATCNRQW
jgi:hypothetical protein